MANSPESNQTVMPDNSHSLLDQEVAIMAGRFATLLRQRFANDNTAISLSLKFLDFRYQSVFGDTPMETWSADSRERFVNAGHTDGNNPLLKLIQLLDLSALQVDMLLMAGLAEEHEGFADIFRSLHPTGMPWPTMGLLAQLVEMQSPLRTSLRENIDAVENRQLSVFVSDVEQPFFSRNLRLLEGLWSWLQGVDAWPDNLPASQIPVVTIGLDHWLYESEVSAIRQHLNESSSFILHVTSEHMDTSLNRAAALCHRADVEYRLVKLGQLFKNLDQTVAFKLLQIHCLIRGIVPIIPLEMQSSGEGEKNKMTIESLDLNAFPAPIIFCSDNHHSYDHPYLSITDQKPIQSLSIKPLDSDSLRMIWSILLPELADESHQLAARYPFEPYQVQQICTDVRHRHAYDSDNSSAQPISLNDIALVVRSRSGNSLAGGLQLIHPNVDWSKLVLPEMQLSQLRDAANRLQLQSTVLDEWKFLEGKRGARGVRMLFSGSPGTGKTLSAEVMANALGVDLLQVDLSRVVSKWLGETEKNLSEIFNAAESTRAVLFFDEADSLFGKRTEVSDAHDRYANLETSYLLSRLERYDGLAVLATNHRQNMDTAFSRRLEFIIEFEEPGAAERVKLWECHIPESAPLDDDVNFTELARLFPIVGGHIRNAAVSAAFLAAQDQQKINREHFITAIKREYEKSGKAYREVSRR